jgi:hypothetical protein
MDTKPLGPLSEPEKCFLVEWRRGRHIDKQDILILILAGLVLLNTNVRFLVVPTSSSCAALDVRVQPPIASTVSARNIH